jgi:hypothetical protein
MSKNRGSTQTTTQTSQIPAWLEEGAQDNLALANDLAAQPTGTRVAPFNPTLMQGANAILTGANVGRDTTGAGVNVLTGEAGYRPMMVDPAMATGAIVRGVPGMTAANVGPALTVSAASAEAARITRGDVRDIRAGSLNGMDLSGYFNPWEDNVVNVALSDIGRQGAIAGNAARARSAAAGVFGDRRDVLEAETDRNYADAAARTAAGLRAQGYARSQDLATGDINRDFQAQGANQSADLSVAGQNAGFTQQANLTNAGSQQDAARTNAQLSLQARLADAGFAQEAARTNTGFQQQAALADAGFQQQVGLSNQAATNTGQLANQGADAQGAALRTQVGQQLIGAGVTQQDQALRAGQAITGVGELFRDNEQRVLDDPYRALAIRQAALTGTPFSQTQTTTSPLYRNTGAGILGGAATGAGIGRLAGFGGGAGALAGGLLGLF